MVERASFSSRAWAMLHSILHVLAQQPVELARRGIFYALSFDLALLAFAASRLCRLSGRPGPAKRPQLATIARLANPD